MNPKSTGFVRLQSKNPTDKLLIDPQLLSHPFDRRTAVEAIRHVIELVETPAVSKDAIKLVGDPKSKSDEDLLISCHMLSVPHFPPELSSVRKSAFNPKLASCNRNM